MQFTARLLMTKAQGSHVPAHGTADHWSPSLAVPIKLQLLPGENWVSLGSYTSKRAEMTKQDRR